MGLALPLVVILAGGAGTRIRHLLPDLPKPLAPVGGRPFLEWIVSYLYQQGARRIVLSSGYKAAQIETFAAGLLLPGLSIKCVEETTALGTAGGFLHAVRAGGNSDEEKYLVCNGDSLLLCDLDAVTTALDDPEIDGAIAAVSVPDTNRYGSIECSPEGELVAFREKRSGAGIANAGLYLLRKRTLSSFPSTSPLSFELDVFPRLVSTGKRIRIVPTRGPFLDIGTAQSLSEAEAFVRDNATWFSDRANL